MTPTLAVFGASGRTGAHVIEAARRRGWRVRAQCRGAVDGRPVGEGLQWVEAALDDAGAVGRVLEQCRAACCVFGPRPPFSEIFCAAATKVIVAAMARSAVGRLVCQTGAMIGDYPENRSWAMQQAAAQFARRRPEAAADRVQQEALVRQSPLIWTLVKPPRLSERPRGRPVTAGPRLRVGLLSSVGRGDLASFLVDELAEPRFAGQAVFVAY